MSKTTKEMWINTGFDILTQEGPPFLTISRLCEKLDVSKGSFYHWFDSKEELDLALLETWSEHGTDGLIQLTAKAASPKEKLQILVGEGFTRFIEKNSYNLIEIAFEGWALTDPWIHQFVMNIRRKRFEFLLSIFNEMERDKNSARRLAMKFYSLALGISDLPITPTKKDLEEIFSEFLS